MSEYKMEREMQVSSVMFRRGYTLVGLEPLGAGVDSGSVRSAEMDDRKLMLRFPSDIKVKQGDRFTVTVTPSAAKPAVEVEVDVEESDVDPGLSIGDEPSFDYDV